MLPAGQLSIKATNQLAVPAGGRSLFLVHLLIMEQIICSLIFASITQDILLLATVLCLFQVEFAVFTRDPIVKRAILLHGRDQPLVVKMSQTSSLWCVHLRDLDKFRHPQASARVTARIAPRSV